MRFCCTLHEARPDIWFDFLDFLQMQLRRQCTQSMDPEKYARLDENHFEESIWFNTFFIGSFNSRISGILGIAKKLCEIAISSILRWRIFLYKYFFANIRSQKIGAATFGSIVFHLVSKHYGHSFNVCRSEFDISCLCCQYDVAFGEVVASQAGAAFSWRGKL